MLLIKNGTVLTMEGETIEKGYVLVSGGKIAAVGRMSELSGTFDEEVDARGGFIAPGFVDAHSHIGMWEDGLAFEGDDGNEDTDPITPHLRALDAVNPLDCAFEEALMAGVTCVVTGPGSANPIGGQFVAMKTSGKCVDEMVLKEPAAMKLAFGENPKHVYHSKNQAPVTRMGTAALIREVFMKAKRYDEKCIKYSQNPSDEDEPEFDFKLESLRDVISGRLLVKAHAHRADDIFTAIRIAKEFNLKMTIEHCTEGHIIKEYLKKENIAVCVGPSLTDRSKPELKNLSLKTAGELDRAGLCVAIITDHPETPEKFLPLCAALAVREGMSPERALAAITVNAAKNCAIDDRVGSLKAGKDADICIFDKYPVCFDANPSLVMVNGRIVKNITK